MKILLVLALLSTTSFSAQQARFIKSKINGKFINYLIHLPYFKAQDYPLLVFLHGVGEKAKSDSPLNDHDLEALKKHGPSKLIDQNLWDENLPFIVVSIQCFKGCRHHQPELVNEVIEEVKMIWPVDDKRLYLTGISMGANGVMRYLARYPRKVAAAVPIAGWGAGNYTGFSNTAWWGIHNRGDEVVSSNGTIEVYRRLKSLPRRASTKMTILEQDGHDAWSDTYSLKNGLDIYSFMLSHSLQH